MRHPSSARRAAQFMLASPRSAKQVRTSSWAKALARTSYTRGLASFFMASELIARQFTIRLAPIAKRSSPGVTMRLLGFLCTLLVFSAVGIPAGHAELTRFDIASQQPFGSFRAGNYVISEGKIHGELSPRESIPGIEKAKRNARGMAEYSARIVLITPEVPSRGNGTLLVDIPNRGKAYSQTLYDAPRDEVFQSGTFEQGTWFLQDNGFSVAEVYWELGRGAELPSFADGDGRTRYVEGAGFAIVRDAADFLAHAAAESPAGRNPLAGAVRRTLASGKSQSGRFLKSFLLNGFNVANGRRV